MGIRDWFKGIRERSTFYLNEDDVVVFLVGPSGSGKSSFLNDVTKSRVVVVGTSLRPSTVTPQAIRCELTEEAKSELGVSSQKNIVFVDTPSFHTGRNDGAEKEMGNWLNKVKFKSTRIGTIYMHRVETDPEREPIQPHLSTFAGTLPQSVVSHVLPGRLHVVFSYEGKIAEEKIDRHRAVFRRQLGALGTSVIHGKVLRWNTSISPNLFERDDSETAWKAVVTLFSTC